MIPLFPASSVDASVLTSVLVGLLVVWLLEEALGWNFTGLVVPGYLGSVIAIEPTTGMVILAEAIATWLAFLVIGDRVPRWWPYAPLFGRDRFLAILLLSVAVRVGFEGGGLEWLQTGLGLAVDDRLHSVGLVVVPLAANAMWRSGPLLAPIRVGGPALLTWVTLTQVLLPYTNLSLSSFELHYEDSALDLRSNATLYVVMLFAASLGSYANLRWGWDYGGILVPGLLALCWFDPVTVAATLGEGLVVAALYEGVRRLPWLRSANLTGGRPLVLAFTIAYAVRMFVARPLNANVPWLADVPLHGFGYLVPAMMALRIARSHDPMRVFGPLIATSLVGLFGALGTVQVLADARQRLLATTVVGVPADDVAAERLAWSAPTTGDLPAARHVEVDTAWPVAGGVVWARAHGDDRVVRAVGDDDGLFPAAIAIAAREGAGVVHLCPHRAACEDTFDALGAPWLEVVAGPGDLVVGDRPGLVARLRAPTAPGDTPRAVLSPRARWSLAREVRAAAPRRAWPVDMPLAPTGASRLSDTDARALVHGLGAALVAWARGDEDAGVVAAGYAAGHGLGLIDEGRFLTVTGADVRVVIDRRGDDTVVYAPRAGRERGLGELAARSARAIGASMLVVDDPPDADDLGFGRVGPALALAWLGSAPDAGVLALRMMPAGGNLGPDVVLDAGRQVGPGLREDPMFARAEAWASALGVAPAWQRGHEALPGLTDSRDPLRALARVRTTESGAVSALVAQHVWAPPTDLPEPRVRLRIDPARCGPGPWAPPTVTICDPTIGCGLAADVRCEGPSCLVTLSGPEGGPTEVTAALLSRGTTVCAVDAP